MINGTALLQRIGRAMGLSVIRNQIDEAKILAARSLILQLRAQGWPTDVQAAEFKVFSQFGEDGIIQMLIDKVGIERANQTFVEFGVENYQEANTRFLLMNNNWRGLIIDGSAKNMDALRRSDIAWRHDLTAVGAFICAENINDLLVNHGFSGQIGLLSIDIDGNDYWVWQRIEVVSPIIVVVEYNSVFGPDRAITVPYDPKFVRSRAHYSHLYWGASLKALDLVARSKGYSLVGSNAAGNNAFFVREDRLGDLKPLSVADAYVESRFREGRNPDGSLSFVSGSDRIKVIEHLPVYDVEKDQTLTIREALEK